MSRCYINWHGKNLLKIVIQVHRNIFSNKGPTQEGSCDPHCWQNWWSFIYKWSKHQFFKSLNLNLWKKAKITENQPKATSLLTTQAGFLVDNRILNPKFRTLKLICSWSCFTIVIFCCFFFWTGHHPFPLMNNGNTSSVPKYMKFLFWTQTEHKRKRERGEWVQHRRETPCECASSTHSPWGENPTTLSQKTILTKGKENIQHSNKETEHSKVPHPRKGHKREQLAEAAYRDTQRMVSALSVPCSIILSSSTNTHQVRIILEHRCPSWHCLLILTLQQTCPIIQEHTWREHHFKGVFLEIWAQRLPGCDNSRWPNT